MTTRSGQADGIRAILNSLEGRMAPSPASATPPDTTVADQKRIRAILVARKARPMFFDADLFADPVWDMLLELYLARVGQFDLSVTDLCIASAVPPTTALRWMKEMEKRELLRRRHDPSDGRRVFVSLTEPAKQQMVKLLELTALGESLV